MEMIIRIIYGGKSYDHLVNDKVRLKGLLLMMRRELSRIATANPLHAKIASQIAVVEERLAEINA